MAANQDGSGGSQSPSVKGEAVNLSLEQVQALVEGGLFDKLINKSPAIAAMHDRLATMETRSGEITSGINQLNEQLKTIAAALQAPTAGAETPAGAPAADAGVGSLAAWAPLINALGIKALGGGQPADPFTGAVDMLMKVMTLYNSIQATALKGVAESNKILRDTLRGEPAHLEAE